ncbi:VWA domain-containing protein [Mariniluteicoccus flavus]
MTLAFWPLLIVALVVIAVGAWFWRRRDPAARAVPAGIAAANTDRLRQSKRYQRLAASALRWSLVSLVSTVLMTAGALLLVGRLAAAAESKDVQHNRDIMLCLDVSGSMTNTDAEMLRAFHKIVGQMRGERVGLTIWNNSAVLVFPLTNDYQFVAEQIETAAKAIDANDFSFTDGTTMGRGSSLIGDGLASCVQRFDRLDEPRSRSIILATDNDLNGKPAFTLTESIDMALAKKITVYGIAKYEDDDVEALRTQVRRTQGEMYLVNGPGAGDRIVAAISATEARRLDGAGAARVTDLPLAGLVLCTAGALGLALAGPVRGLVARRDRRAS